MNMENAAASRFMAAAWLANVPVASELFGFGSMNVKPPSTSHAESSAPWTSSTGAVIVRAANTGLTASIWK